MTMTSSPPVIPIQQIDAQAKARVHAILYNGGLIAYPTDTIYGLGVDIRRPEAVQRSIDLKGRASGKPISLMYPNLNLLLTDFNHLNGFQIQMVKCLLPGRITILLPVEPEKFRNPLFISGGYTGVRVIDFPATADLWTDYPAPIATTSANPAGLPPARSVAEITRYFPAGLDLLLDAGPLDAVPSTIIRLYDCGFEIIRSGAEDLQSIQTKVHMP